MKRFLVIVNEQKEEALDVGLQIKEYLEQHQCQCIVHNVGGRYIGESNTAIPKEVVKDAECVLVLGGDGTLIRVAAGIQQYNLPMLGINLGTMGFLTEIEPNQISTALDKLMHEEYTIEDRMMVAGCVRTAGVQSEEQVALNDVVITRAGSLRVVEFNIYVNGAYLHSYQADGIIISTPTGSTGYNLSAGGPIVEPQAAMLLITPICPHTLNARTIVLSKDDYIEVEIGPARSEELEKAEVAFDGYRQVLLKTGDRVCVRNSESRARIIKINERSFLEILRRKMG